MTTPDWSARVSLNEGAAGAAGAIRMSVQSEEIDPRVVRVVRVEVANGFFGRARGLLFGRRLPSGVGLLFERTRSVHGFGMDRALDLAFIDAESVVRRICVLAPMRWQRCERASAVIEFEAGEVARLGVRAGDRLSLMRRTVAVPVLPRAIGLVLLLAAMGQSIEAHAQMSGVFSPGWVARFAARAESLYRSGEDVAAIQAWETVARMDHAQQAQSLLRIGNVHQRNGRRWDAMQTYSQLLVWRPDIDESEREARRKALSNLLELHETMAAQAARVLDDAANAGRDLTSARPFERGRDAVARTWPAAQEFNAAPPSRTPPAPWAIQPADQPPRHSPLPSAGGSTPSPMRTGLPRVEYLRSSSADAQPDGRRARVAR